MLGGHWEDEVELFYMVQGVLGSLVLEDITSQEQRIFEELGPGTRIVLPPRVAHTLIFRQAATLIAMTENPFSPEKLVPYVSLRQPLPPA